VTTRHLPSIISQRDLGLFPGTKPLGKRTRRGRTSSYPGIFASTKCLGVPVFDSLLERDFQSLLCADSRVDAYAVQAHQLTYWTPGLGGAFKQRLYTPDIVLRRQGGQMAVIEVKAEAFTRDSYWREREPYIRRAYKQDHATDFVVVTERVVRVQPRLSNYEKMLRLGARLHDPVALAAVRDALSSTSPNSSLGEICDATLLTQNRLPRAYSALMSLALKGEVVLDLDRPLSLSTRILSRHDT
jgi:hypothetical protein